MRAIILALILLTGVSAAEAGHWQQHYGTWYYHSDDGSLYCQVRGVLYIWQYDHWVIYSPPPPIYEPYYQPYRYRSYDDYRDYRYRRYLDRERRDDRDDRGGRPKPQLKPEPKPEPKMKLKSRP